MTFLIALAMGLALGFVAATRLARKPSPQPIRVRVDGRNLDAKVIDLAFERRRRQPGR